MSLRGGRRPTKQSPPRLAMTTKAESKIVKKDFRRLQAIERAEELSSAARSYASFRDTGWRLLRPVFTPASSHSGKREPGGRQLRHTRCRRRHAQTELERIARAGAPVRAPGACDARSRHRGEIRGYVARIFRAGEGAQSRPARRRG